MFHSVSLFSQAPLARGFRALPSVLLALVVDCLSDWSLLELYTHTDMKLLDKAKEFYTHTNMKLLDKAKEFYTHTDMKT